MQIRERVSLADYSTMRLGGIARALVEVQSKDELLQALRWASQRQLPILMLGGGSNVIFKGDYEGLVIINHLGGFEVLRDDADGATVRASAGEPWDSVVQRTVELGLSGLEMLSAIPGSTGATPVQNVGAYGAEIADTFVELEAYDMQAHQFVTLNKSDCQFGYRTSIFKSLTERRYIITTVTFRLSKQAPKPPFYASLQKYLDLHHITTYTPQIIRDAVIDIRSNVLPDPTRLANTGSFFKNPIVPAAMATALKQNHPEMPQYPMDDGRVKIPAGWLIDHTGLKGYHGHGMRTYEKNALVLVNDRAKDYGSLEAFRQEIIQAVQHKFAVTLEQEPELI